MPALRGWPAEALLIHQEDLGFGFLTPKHPQTSHLPELNAGLTHAAPGFPGHARAGGSLGGGFAQKALAS